MSTSETQVKERPILFSGQMVRALLTGTKTQTRRVMKHPLAQASQHILSYKGQSEFDCVLPDKTGGIILCPYGKPGDRLWVRETYQSGFSTHVSHYGYLSRATDVDKLSQHGAWCYEKNGKAFDHYDRPFNWKPSIFMKRVASRLLLEIVRVRAERLQDITEPDACAEGVESQFYSTPKNHNHGPLDFPGFTSFKLPYERLWGQINGPESWAANPWVWVVEFKIVNNLI